MHLALYVSSVRSLYIEICLSFSAFIHPYLTHIHVNTHTHTHTHTHNHTTHTQEGVMKYLEKKVKAMVKVAEKDFPDRPPLVQKPLVTTFST